MDNPLRHFPRLVVGAPQGRSGKTTVTIGLLAALKERGLLVQPFKKGPDFIDPSWMTMVTGRACRNLDGYMMNRELIRNCFMKGSCGADISVVEGAMGLFDGVDLEGSGSTAEIAKSIAAPVLLVVDTTRMTRSVAAMVSGFMHFDPGLVTAGVILNKVARPRHESMLRKAVEKYCGLPVLGAVPKGSQFSIPDRHLGLIPANERDELARLVEDIGKMAQQCLDIDKIIALAGAVPGLAVSAIDVENEESAGDNAPVIGIFKDRAFSFYYPENLEALKAAGAKIVSINSLQDKFLPPLDGLYIGGGFPEVFATELEANAGLAASLSLAVEQGMPVYAECGGLMYLGRSLMWQNKSFKMSGVLPFDVDMSEKPQGHGYEDLEVTGKNPFFETGLFIRGHEFHHSKLINIDEERISYAYRVTRGWGVDGQRDGIVYKNVLASYSHLHALGTPAWARGVVEKARQFKRGK